MSPPRRLDLRGLRCPLPVVRLEAALREAGPGTRIAVVADDPIAAVDIPHFARSAGHGCEPMEADAGGQAVAFLVTRRPA